MAVRIWIPTPLRPYTDQHKSVDVEAGTVGEALAALTSHYGGLRKQLYDDDGESTSYREGSFAETEIDCQSAEGRIRIRIAPVAGSATIVPAERCFTLRVRVPGLPSAVRLADGSPIAWRMTGSSWLEIDRVRQPAELHLAW